MRLSLPCVCRYFAACNNTLQGDIPSWFSAFVSRYQVSNYFSVFPDLIDTILAPALVLNGTTCPGGSLHALCDTASLIALSCVLLIQPACITGPVQYHHVHLHRWVLLPSRVPIDTCQPMPAGLLVPCGRIGLYQLHRRSIRKRHRRGHPVQRRHLLAVRCWSLWRRQWTDELDMLRGMRGSVRADRERDIMCADLDHAERDPECQQLEYAVLDSVDGTKRTGGAVREYAGSVVASA